MREAVREITCCLSSGDAINYMYACVVRPVTQLDAQPVYITTVLFLPFQGKPVAMPPVYLRLSELEEEEDEDDLLLTVAIATRKTPWVVFQPLYCCTWCS